jgi:hypothetical protein
MLSVIYKPFCVECRYAECRYVECHYAEYRYAECRYASVVALPSQGPKPQTISSLYLRTILIFFNIVAHSRVKEHNYICNIYYEIYPKYLPQNLTLQCLPIVVLITTLH